MLIDLSLGAHASAFGIRLVVARRSGDSRAAGAPPRVHRIDLVADTLAGLGREGLESGLTGGTLKL
jgi:hypothetical protein